MTKRSFGGAVRAPLFSIPRGLGAGLLLLVGIASAGTVYQAPEAFVRKAFGGEPPAPKALWLTGEVAEGYEATMGHAPRRLRLRYWAADGRSVWVLEAIGKERPLTAGFVVESDRVVRTRLLVFRESRGAEVRLPAFTRQFRGAGLGADRRLDRAIDGVTGATLSVRAMKKMARLALYLDRARR